VPLIARWPGRIPAGKVNNEPAIMMDLFATTLAAAGRPASGYPAPLGDRVIDGKDLLPVFTGSGPGPHDVIFGHQGARLATVRDGRWKLHVLPSRERAANRPQGKWVDPRGPDGVTLLAPYEQAQPTEYPGLRTGDDGKAMSLFDLANDPAEQHNVAAQHPDVVARLKGRYDQMVAELAARAVPGVP